jgi:imidazolonepropionase
LLTLWRNASIATCDDDRRVIADGAVVTDDDTIAWVGTAAELPARFQPERTIELAGRWLTPGLIDCHTHIVFGGQRAAEFARRTAGTSYADIAREGGGILNTVRATRAASVEELVRASEPRLRALLQEGVTTVEIKSGYGLDFDAERRMLLAARALEQRLPVTVVTSLLAAHAVPPEYQGRGDDYIELICREWLPRFAREHSPHPNPLPLMREREQNPHPNPLPLTREREQNPHPNPLPPTREREHKLVDMVDAYCEDIAFSASQLDRLFSTAKALGWPVRLHSEQISNIGGARLAARHGALACDHLEYATEEDARHLARAGTVAVMLPVAYYVLADPQLPPIKHLRAHGVPMAVASDANPGSAPGASLQTAMNMARRLFGLTSNEVLDGVTRHAARALGLGGDHGQIAPGYRADFAVWSIDTLDELGYWIGFNPCSMVVRGGEIVLEREA